MCWRLQLKSEPLEGQVLGSCGDSRSPFGMRVKCRADTADYHFWALSESLHGQKLKRVIAFPECVCPSLMNL